MAAIVSLCESKLKLKLHIPIALTLTRLLCAHVTSKTNTRTLHLCVRFKYGSFYRRFKNTVALELNYFVFEKTYCFRSFLSLFESISIDYKTVGHALELNYFVFETLSAAFFGIALKGPLIPHMTDRTYAMDIQGAAKRH